MARRLARTIHLLIGLLGTSRPFTVLHRGLYRRLGGRGVLHGGLGVDVILLTTTGRRSRERRVVPLFAFPLDRGPEGPGAARSDEPSRWVVVASFAGRDRAPAWYRNLEADPSVEVQHMGRRAAATARIASDEERGRLWPLVVAGYPGYEVYQDRTDRRIPVVVLEPR